MSTTRKSLGFIGGGRITRIMLNGFMCAGALPENILIAEPNDDVFGRLSATVPSAIRTDNKTAAGQEIVFGALHPPAMPSVLAEIAPALHPEALFVSLAPRVSIASLSQQLQGFTRIVRLLPNAPSIINMGYNPITFSSALTQSELGELLALFRTLGECPEVSEDKIEAYAVLVAMGPTYFWFQWQELMKLGLAFGLEQAETEAALAAMLHGATEVMFKAGLQAGEAMDLVPVKPLADDEPAIRAIYSGRLEALYKKLKS